MDASGWGARTREEKEGTRRRKRTSEKTDLRFRSRLAARREELPFARHQGADEMNKYKYLVDVDGNSYVAFPFVPFLSTRRVSIPLFEADSFLFLVV